MYRHRRDRRRAALSRGERLLRRPFGLVVAGVRQDDLKTELLGYDVRGYRLAVCSSLGGAVAGIAGGLFGGWATYINPNVFSIAAGAAAADLRPGRRARHACSAPSSARFAVGGLSFWLGGGVIGGQTTLVLGLVLIVLVALVPARRGRRRAARLLAWCGLGTVSATPPITLGGSLDSPAGRSGTQPGVRAGRLTMQGMSKAFGGVLAVDDVTIEVASGSMRCLIGPNGAGKSTLLAAVRGAAAAGSGSVRLGGDEITRWPPYARVQAGLGIKTQRRRCFTRFRSGPISGCRLRPGRATFAPRCAPQPASSPGRPAGERA